MKKIYWLQIILALIFSKSLAQDLIILNNGDEVHGEIKTLNQSVLTCKTVYSDSDFKIEWDDVVDIVSQREFTVFLSSGEKFYVSFDSTSNDATIFLLADGIEREVPLLDIVVIDPIKKDFSGRFDASISAGFTLTKANNSSQISIRADIGYHAKDWALTATFNDVQSTQDEVEPIHRTEGSIRFQYLFYKRWFVGVQSEFLSNTEQQLNLRSTHTPAIGNFIVRTNKVNLEASVGMTFNREDYSNKTEIVNSKEGFVGVSFNAYDTGDLSFKSSFGYFPSFTDNDRYRMNVAADLKYEFPHDFFIKLGYTLNYDSNPPNDGAKDDYVFQTTIGWEF